MWAFNFVKMVLGFFFGGGPTVQAVVDGLTKAHADSLNAKTEEEKIDAKLRIDTLTAALVDLQNARVQLGKQPWWLATIACMIGFGFALHLFLVCVGTAFAPLIVGGVFDWMLHIPKLPDPYDKAQLSVVAFFYGYASVLAGSGKIAAAITQKRR